MAELSTEVEKKKQEQPLPLVVEILPGQAGEGLLEVFEAGSYEKKKLGDLCQEMLARHDWSIEERQILDDIQRQLHGGKLLAKGRNTQSRSWNMSGWRNRKKGGDISIFRFGQSSRRRGAETI